MKLDPRNSPLEDALSAYLQALEPPPSVELAAARTIAAQAKVIELQRRQIAEQRKEFARMAAGCT